MHYFITLLLLMSTITSNAQDGKASTTKKTFSRTTSISIQIAAEPTTVWALLTDAEDFPNWNSTVTALDGTIATGEKIQLKSTLAPDRTFKLKVKEMVPNQLMVWGDAMGKRTYTLESTDGGTLFTMSEKIGGPLFPLFAGQIPDFDETFEQFAADLKNAAEAKN
ncbi:MAG: SRPBCC domain-containing protein [Bacteroidota bacterium]